MNSIMGLQLLPRASLMVRWASSCLLDTSYFLERMFLSLVDVIFSGMHLVDVFIVECNAAARAILLEDGRRP
jgi:hypothetical protein